MTQLKTLLLERMLVLQNRHTAYDEEFHAGVNIIASAGNSKGKSTVADLIFYGLGGEGVAWKDEAARCSHVLCQVALNNRRVTLRREITDKRFQPMSVHFGGIETALADSTDWNTYPYARHGDKESFSQKLFQYLDLPEIPVELSNLTMHQALRLMYQDQLTQNDRIFRSEDRDSIIIREAVGDLICGVLNPAVYKIELRIREIERLVENLDGQIKGARHVLLRSGEMPTTAMVDETIRNVEVSITNLQVKLQGLRNADSRRQIEDEVVRERVEALRTLVQSLNVELEALRREATTLALIVADSQALIIEIENTLKSLEQSTTVREVMGYVSVHVCPSCFSKIEENSDEGVCALCKSRLDPDAEKSRFLRLRNELEQQKKESESLIVDRQERIAQVHLIIRDKTEERARFAIEYESLLKAYIVDADAAALAVARQLGAQEQELENWRQKRRLLEELEALAAERADLVAEINRARAELDSLREHSEARRKRVKEIIGSSMLDTIQRDTESTEFAEVADIYVDFAADRFRMTGKTGFSASSLTVIKSSFYIAMLIAACEDRAFGLPMFLLLDNIEDKGMTEGRSQNFQEVIVDISRKLRCPHQIIYTTSAINPEFENSDYMVGPLYSEDQKSLNVI